VCIVTGRGLDDSGNLRSEASSEDFSFLARVSRPGYSAHTISGLPKGVCWGGGGVEASGATASGSRVQGEANENNWFSTPNVF